VIRLGETPEFQRLGLQTRLRFWEYRLAALEEQTEALRDLDPWQAPAWARPSLDALKAIRGLVAEIRAQLEAQ
jgi:hypothetical protein